MASSSSSSAIKAAAKVAERLSVMEQARSKFVDKFRAGVANMIKDHPFQQGQCIALEIAKSMAISMGVQEDSVEVKELHNHWKSAEFVHRIITPMPPPPKKGMPKDPPVITTTVFKVILKSAIIDSYFLKINEDGTNLGPDIFVQKFQRPQITKSP